MDSKTVAFHEAAHAVMCLSVGIKFSHVTIIPDKIYRGHLDTKGQEVKGLFEFVGLIEALMAGTITQSYLRGKSINDIWSESKKESSTKREIGPSDYNEIIRLVGENRKYLSAEEQPEFMAWILQRTKVHLAQRWKHVERIAAALQEKRTLSYEECKELMTAKPVGADPVKNG